MMDGTEIALLLVLIGLNLITFASVVFSGWLTIHKLNQQEKQMADTTPKIDDIVAEEKVIEGDVQQTSTLVTQAITQLSTQTTTINGLNDKVTALEAQLAAAGTPVDLSAIKTELDSLKTNTEGINTTLNQALNPAPPTPPAGS